MLVKGATEVKIGVRVRNYIYVFLDGSYHIFTSLPGCCVTGRSVARACKNQHYRDVIMTAMASQITGVSIDCTTVCSSADQITQQSPASLVPARGIRR